MSKESIETLIEEEVENRVAKVFEELGDLTPAVNTDGLPGVVCRCYSSGVIAGYLKYTATGHIELVNARFCRTFKAGKIGSANDLAIYGPDEGSQIQAPRQMTIVGDQVVIIYATDVAMRKIMEYPEA